MRNISFENFRLMSKNIRELIYKTYMVLSIDETDDPGYVTEVKKTLTEEKTALKSMLRNYDKQDLFDTINNYIIESINIFIRIILCRIIFNKCLNQ